MTWILSCHLYFQLLSLSSCVFQGLQQNCWVTAGSPTVSVCLAVSPSCRLQGLWERNSSSLQSTLLSFPFVFFLFFCNSLSGKEFPAPKEAVLSFLSLITIYNTNEQWLTRHRDAGSIKRFFYFWIWKRTERHYYFIITSAQKTGR